MTKTTILAFVNNVLKEAFTDIDTEIIATVNDLSKFNLLTGEDTDQTGSDGTENLVHSTDFKKLTSITPNDGSFDLEPLRAVPGGFKEYRRWMQSFNAGLRGSPTHYVDYEKKFFLYPTLNGAYTFVIKFYKFHAQSADAIEFGDDFVNAINYGAAYHAALFRKKTSYINIWRPIYHEERRLMILMNPPQPSFVGA